MENGETALQAAMRETREEAGARIESSGLYGFCSPTSINEVYVIFRAQLLDHSYAAGAESSEVGLFSEAAVPWDALSYPVVGAVLRRFFTDLRQGSFSIHVLDEGETT